MGYEKVYNGLKEVQNAKKPKAQKVLEKLGYQFNDNGDIVVDLIADTNTGKKNFGKITYEAYKAIENNKLDSYKPKDYEKKVLDGYKQYTGMFTPNNTIPTTNTTQDNKTNGGNVEANKSNTSTTADLSAEQKAYIKYAVNKDSNIEGVNNEQKLLGGDTARYIAAPKKNAWEKFTDNVSNWFEETFSGTMADKWHQEATGFVDNKAAWTDDQLATLAVDALHRADLGDTRDFAIVDQAHARLSRSSKYKDSDLVLALTEAKKSWGASPLTAAGKNVKAAVYGMGADFASFTDSIGADKVPGLNSLNDAVINAGKQAREEASVYNKGMYGETLGTFTQGVTNLVPYYFLGSGKAATTALSKAPKYATYIKTIAQNPSFWYSLTTMWGQKYQEALDGGASKNDALNNAILYSVPAALVEVSGGIGSPNGNEKISSTILEEIGEEIAQDIISGAADKATTNPNLPVLSFTEDAIVNPINLAKTAITTAPIVAVAGGANIGINKVVNLTNQRIQARKLTNDKKVVDSIAKFTNDVYSTVSSDNADISKIKLSNSELKKVGALYSDEATLKTLVTEGLESPEGTVSRTIADTLNKKVKAKENISNLEIGELVVANIKQFASEQVAEEKAKADTKVSNVKETNTPVNAPVNPTIFTGDVFKDSASGNTFTVVGRDSEKTVVEIETPKGKQTREFGNNRIDNLVSSGQVEKIETTPTVEATPTQNTVVAENATTENKVVDDYESEAEELLNTDMTEDETPAETPIVEATAPKVEEAKSSKSKNITLTQSGNTYEAYGEDARIIADSLELETAKQVVNGVETDSIKFPAEFLDGLVDELGGDYNFVTTNKATTEKSSETEKVVVVKNATTTENKAVVETTPKEQKKKVIRAKKSDWTSHDVYWYAPNSNTVIAYSTRAGSDLIEAMAEDNPKMTISELHDAINYDTEAKKVLQAYINSGFGDSIASEHFVHNKGGKVDRESSTTETKPTKANNEVEETTTEAKTQSVAEETATDNNQLPDSFVVDENGKIRFEQMDIDYTDATMRKGKFKNKLSNAHGQHKPYEANGYICGKYGICKSDNGKYTVVHLQGGLGCGQFDKLAEAQQFATYLNDNLPFNDVAYGKGLSKGSIYLLQTEELGKYLNNLRQIMADKPYLAPVDTEVKDGKVPFNTKSGLIDYVKAHIGDKVKATFNNGNSEVRTLHAISNTSLRTKRPDGSVVTSELKGVEYNENGIHIDFKNGVEVTFDFVNVDEVSEEVLKNQSESDTIEERKTTDNNERVGVENGIDERGSVSEKPEQFSETKKLGNQSKKVQDNLSGNDDSGRGKLELYKRGYSDTSRRIKQVETRKLEDIYSDEKFKTFKDVANDSTPLALVNYLHREVYAKDVRLTEEGYDFEDVFAYDLISGKEKELSALFYDEIAEYFNQNNSTDVDSTGKTVTKSILERLKDSIVRNAKGQLIPVYHSTTKDFKKFEKGDIGFHFGSYIQAFQRNITESDVRYIKAYLDIKNPLVFDSDSMGWNAKQILKKLVEKGILSADEAVSYINAKYSHEEVNKIIKEKLEKAGYGGIVYKNQYESINADSYIVFDDSQIIRVEDGGNKNKESVKDVHERVLGRESENDSTVRKSEPVQTVEEERNIGTEDRKFSEDVTSENGTHIQSAETETSATGQLSSGDSDNGVRKSDNSDGNSGIGISGNDNVNDEVTDDTKDTEDVKETTAKDYSITKAVAEELDTKAPNIDDNIKAIETLHELENSGKKPNKTQQSILAKFKGWGGLSNAFWQARSRLKEIMSDSEISAAQSTVNDAYFTPTTIIDSIYKGLNHLGFEGGNILEPSMGVGNFFGRMPKSIKDISSLFGVEIDTISGKIAQYLYPSANIKIAPFQDVAYKDNSFDLIVGNVPFGEVKYKYKNNRYLIHDYFFVKAMDKLNDGGIMVFLTSKGTLDKLDSTTRAELNRQGNIIGAYRLPSNVFLRSAGANVVTDLIIMQKTTNNNGEKFVNTGSVTLGGENFSINEYFVNHPENIIGELTYRRGQYGKYELTVQPTGDVAEQLTKAIKKLPKNLLSGVQTVGTASVMENTSKLQTFYINDKGNVEYVDAQTGEVKELKNTAKNKNNDIAKDYLAIKKAYTDLTNYTLNEADTSTIESKRQDLNALYDGFVKKYGTLDKNKKLLSADNDFYKLSGLEVYDTKTKKVIKSEMFSKDTIGKRKPKKADNALDALSISMGESGTVNLKRISELTNLPLKEVVEQLSDRIIYTPEGTYELNEVYLSGNVREKYEAVKGKKGFEKNEQMLKAVIPEDIPAKNITPQFGASWIEPKYVAQFLKETFQLYSTPKVMYDATTGTWSISGNTWGDRTLLENKYGTKYLDAIQLAEKALNMRQIVVKNKDGLILGGETKAAQQKALDIKNTFEEWCFKDADRRNDLVETFNKLFNSNRNMDFSELAKYLTFNGLSETFKLRDYQKRAVARAIFNGNTLLAHGVGTGKTAEMITIAMELKRMGMAKKNMMVVPPHKVADFRNDILKMYPSAKVAMLEKGANATQRQRFYAQVAANDFDIVLIPHSSFGLLDVSKDTKISFINNQISELEEVLTTAQLEKGSIDGRFIRQLENQKKRLEEKLKFITDSKKDNGNTFEELGVDSLFVDEAHNFKNLPFYTKLSRVAGVSAPQNNNKDRASRAENMFMITDYLNRNKGRITFGTATPITKSISEIYNMMRFLRPDILRDSGLQSFDAWASMFGAIVNKAEAKPSGRGMRMKERFSKFRNVPQMIEQFRRMADILKSGEVIEDLPVAERINVINPSNAIQEEFLDRLDEIISDIQTNGARSEYNMLQVTKAGEMAALDLRMVISYFDGKYTLDDLNLPNNRTSQVAEKVYKEYTESNSTKGTQFVFCDAGVYDNPNGTYGFHVYGDLINKLVTLGIPRNEIAVAQEFEDKADLSAKVNTGEIRVLIGSTAVMGEGMNAQQKAVALHHMTIPDNPAGLEQREGRIIRYGNENKNVRIYRYIQEASYDSYKWQMQERKADIINQALSGGTVEELEEMSDFQLSAREAKAIASGNPLLLEKIEVEDKISNLKTLRKKFNTDKLEMQERLVTLPNRIRIKEKLITTTKADIKTIENNQTKDFEITLGKTKYTERAKAAEALERGISKIPKNGEFVKIGSYKGLDLFYCSSVAKGVEFVVAGEGKYPFMGSDSAIGNITRIINAVEKIPENLSTEEALVKKYKSEVTTLEKEVNNEFPQAKELEELETKLSEIDTALGINVAEVDMSDVFVDEDTDDDDGETVRSSRDLAGADTTDRWRTERTEVSESKAETLKEKATDIANKAIDTVNKIPGVDIPYIEGESVTVAKIVEIIKGNFDIPIATGKVTDRRASGIYKERAESVRVRTANDLPTIFHELGHHLDKLYKLSNKGSIKDLRKAVSKEFLDQYPSEQRDGEAVAEFLRVFLRNTEEAKTFCPTFYNDFVGTLSKSHLKAVFDIGDLANEYMSSDFSDRVRASIVSGNEQEKTALSEKAKKMHAYWVDGFIPIKDAVDYVQETTGTSLSGRQNAYTLATNSLNARAIANFNTVHGFRDLNGNIVQGAKSFIECIADVDKKNLNTFDEYLVLKHSLEWIDPKNKDVTKKRVFADDTLEDVDAIERRIAEIEDRHPEMKKAAENLYEYQRNILKHIVIPAGGMTEATFNSLYEKYPCYVPFYRSVSKIGAKTKATFANQKSPLKRAKGSGEQIISPIVSIINNTDKMVKFALRNQTMQVLTSYADTVDGFGKFIESVPPDMLPHITDITHLKENFEDALQQVVNSGEDYFAVSGLFDEIFGDSVTDFSPIANANKKIVTVLRNGHFSYYQIHDEALYNAIAEFTPKQVKGIAKLSQFLMTPVKLLITKDNPIFAITNALRDIGTAYKHSPINNPLDFAVRYTVALKEVITKGDMYKQWQAMGGGHNSELSANLKQIKRTLSQVAQKDMGKARRVLYSIVHHPILSAAAVNDYIESIPRVMEFVRSLEVGEDLQQAIFNADDITTNFKRSGNGSGAKDANALVMFNNASIQGLYKTYRTLTNGDKTERTKTLLKWALVALISAAIQAFWNKDDEEDYNNLSSYKKNNFYNFSIGDGKFISIPKAREVALLDSLTERTIEYVFGNDEAWYGFGGYVADQLLPPVIPTSGFSLDSLHDVLGSTVLGGAIDVMFNKDFKDIPIESKYDQYLPSNERYNESTTSLAYWLGQTKLARATDMSPKKIDHLISSYTGIIGQMNKALFPMNGSRRDYTIGLSNKFISDSAYSTDMLNKLYDNRDAAKLEWQYADNVNNAIEYEQNAVITSYISGMKKAIKSLPEDKQREGRKYLLKTLNEWNYELTSQQKNMQSNLKNESVGIDYIFDELPSSKLEWTQNKQKYTYQMTPQEYNEYVSIYLDEVEKARKNYGGNSLESYAKAKETAKDRMSNYKKNRLIPKYKSKATKTE
jgi:N12 class adenine-specific DNA methylase